MINDGTTDGMHLNITTVNLAQVPPPLAIGSVELDDGSIVKGFVCEGHIAQVGTVEIASSITHCTTVIRQGGSCLLSQGPQLGGVK